MNFYSPSTTINSTCKIARSTMSAKPSSATSTYHHTNPVQRWYPRDADHLTHLSLLPEQKRLIDSHAVLQDEPQNPQPWFLERDQNLEDRHQLHQNTISGSPMLQDLHLSRSQRSNQKTLQLLLPQRFSTISWYRQCSQKCSKNIDWPHHTLPLQQQGMGKIPYPLPRSAEEGQQKEEQNLESSRHTAQWLIIKRQSFLQHHRLRLLERTQIVRAPNRTWFLAIHHRQRSPRRVQLSPQLHAARLQAQQYRLLQILERQTLWNTRRRGDPSLVPQKLTVEVHRLLAHTAHRVLRADRSVDRPIPIFLWLVCHHFWSIGSQEVVLEGRGSYDLAAAEIGLDCPGSVETSGGGEVDADAV